MLRPPTDARAASGISHMCSVTAGDASERPHICGGATAEVSELSQMCGVTAGEAFEH